MRYDSIIHAESKSYYVLDGCDAYRRPSTIHVFELSDEVNKLIEDNINEVYSNPDFLPLLRLRLPDLFKDAKYTAIDSSICYKCHLFIPYMQQSFIEDFSIQINATRENIERMYDTISDEPIYLKDGIYPPRDNHSNDTMTFIIVIALKKEEMK